MVKKTNTVMEKNTFYTLEISFKTNLYVVFLKGYFERLWSICFEWGHQDLFEGLVEDHYPAQNFFP